MISLIIIPAEADRDANMTRGCGAVASLGRSQLVLCSSGLNQNEPFN